MKNIVTIIILLVSIQLGFSQACGVYRIHYVGKIQADSIEINTIKLPTIQCLHGSEKLESKEKFVEIRLEKRKINLELTSHLTSDLFDNPKRYWEIYQNNRPSLPIILSIKDKSVNKIKEITIEIPWEEIEITKVDDEKFGHLSQINLNEMKLIL